MLYAQTLSRLVGLGFMVVAVDSPGHGATDPLGSRARIEDYVEDLEQVLVGARHPAGGARRPLDGRAASSPSWRPRRPTLAVGVILIDPIMGDTGTA